MRITDNEIIEILQTEKACVTRAMKNECNRDCYNCDLCEEGKDILTVYDSVITTDTTLEAIKKEVRNKAIDEFAERLKSKVEEKISLQMFLDEDDLLDKDQVNKYIDEIAEELKAGE